MVVSFNKPVNTSICSGEGTIFSSSSASGGGGTGAIYNFQNIGSVGARILASTFGGNISFRRVKDGTNTQVVEGSDNVSINVSDLLFDSSAPIKRAVPGLQGIILNQTGILSTLRALLYPTIAPQASLSATIFIFEYGDTSVIPVSWTATKTDEPILTISVNGTFVPATGNTQSGISNVVNPGNSNLLVPMQVTTLTQFANTQLTIPISRRIRIGASLKDGLIAQILDSDINNLTGFFSSTAKLPQTGFVIPNNNYLVISIPQILGTTPVFRVNGFVNNSFIQVRTNSVFVNSFGFPDPVNVWISKSFATGTLQLEID